MLEAETLDRFKAKTRDALETYLDKLTLPSLQGFAPARPVELTSYALLHTTGPTPVQTIKLSVRPLKTVVSTVLLTFGPGLQEPLKLDGTLSLEAVGIT